LISKDFQVVTSTDIDGTFA